MKISICLYVLLSSFYFQSSLGIESEVLDSKDFMTQEDLDRISFNVTTKVLQVKMPLHADDIILYVKTGQSPILIKKIKQ